MGLAQRQSNYDDQLRELNNEVKLNQIERQKRNGLYHPWQSIPLLKFLGVYESEYQGVSITLLTHVLALLGIWMGKTHVERGMFKGKFLCDPTDYQMVKELKISPRSVQQALRTLENLGLIKRHTFPYYNNMQSEGKKRWIEGFPLDDIMVSDAYLEALYQYENPRPTLTLVDENYSPNEPLQPSAEESVQEESDVEFTVKTSETPLEAANHIDSQNTPNIIYSPPKVGNDLEGNAIAFKSGKPDDLERKTSFPMINSELESLPKTQLREPTDYVKGLIAEFITSCLEHFPSNHFDFKTFCWMAKYIGFDKDRYHKKSKIMSGAMHLVHGNLHLFENDPEGFWKCLEELKDGLESGKIKVPGKVLTAKFKSHFQISTVSDRVREKAMGDVISLDNFRIKQEFLVRREWETLERLKDGHADQRKEATEYLEEAGIDDIKGNLENHYQTERLKKEVREKILLRQEQEKLRTEQQAQDNFSKSSGNSPEDQIQQRILRMKQRTKERGDHK